MSKTVRRSLAGLALAASATAVPVVASAQDAGAGTPLRATAVLHGPGGFAEARPRSTGGTEAPDSPSSSTGAGSGTSTGPVFPIRGRHRYGTGSAAFGGGRGHQGQDVFAACGTRLVAAIAGRVSQATFQSAAGNYLVIDAPNGTSQAYRHLARPATVQQGARVDAGDPIGVVGQTGDAEGCHLHFEFWTAPGWYKGGKPVDPLPRLRRWDAQD
jgi:murein DD-endopeptidase MepM/ murein hydrolase activator NlpD